MGEKPVSGRPVSGRSVSGRSVSGRPVPGLSPPPDSATLMFPELVQRTKYCKLCENEVSERRYIRHIKKCSRPKYSLPLPATRFECELCKKNFSMRSALNMHKTTNHIKAKS